MQNLNPIHVLLPFFSYRNHQWYLLVLDFIQKIQLFINEANLP